MNIWKRWCIVFAGTALGGLGAIFVFMIIIDPYNISMLMTFKKLNAHEPTVRFQSRLAKAVGIIRYKPDTIILGSSIVDGGFNISGSTAHYEPWRMSHDLTHSVTPAVYNAGVRDGAIDDMFAMLKHAYANNPHLKRAFIGIEWSQVTDFKTVGHMLDTPVLGHTTLFPYAYQKYLTWTAFDDAVRTVQDNMGFTVSGVIPDASFWGFLLKRLHFISSASAEEELRVTPISSNLYSKSPVTLKTDLETRMFHFSLWFGTGFLRKLEMGSPANLHREDALSVIKDMIAFAKERNITLIFYASPQPPLFWSVVKKSGTWPHYADWLRKFAEMTPFYDFSALPDVYDKADTYFGDDPLHFSLELGARILPVLLENKHTTDVTYVTHDTVESDIALRSQQLDGWLESHLYESGVINHLRFTPDKSEDITTLLPTPYEPSVNGFHIVRLLTNQFYALPVGSEPYDFLKILNHDYPKVLEAGSLSDILKKIQHTH